MMKERISGSVVKLLVLVVLVFRFQLSTTTEGMGYFTERVRANPLRKQPCAGLVRRQLKSTVVSA